MGAGRSGPTDVGDPVSIGLGRLARQIWCDPDNGVVMEMSLERFEDLVRAALDAVPVELGDLVDNCVVLVEDDPPADEPGLLGVYVGVPLTERDGGYTMALPDRITVFRRPLLAICSTEEELVTQVRITVVHEIAHHFGIDDDRLGELGYA